MDPNLVTELVTLSQLSPQRFRIILRSESSFEFTKALVDIAYNIIKVQSIEVPSHEKLILEKHEDVLRLLLLPDVSLATKRKYLVSYVDLAQSLARSCQEDQTLD